MSDRTEKPFTALAPRDVTLARLRAELAPFGVAVGPRIAEYVAGNISAKGYSVPQVTQVLDMVLEDYDQNSGRLKRTKAFWDAVERSFGTQVATAADSVIQWDELQYRLREIRAWDDSLTESGLDLPFSMIAEFQRVGVSFEEIGEFLEEYCRDDQLAYPEKVLASVLLKVQDEGLTFPCAVDECLREAERVNR